MLSAFPLLLLATSIASYFIDPQWATKQIGGFLGSLVPGGEARIQGIVNGVAAAQSSVTILSGAGLAWAGTRVFAALTSALNVAHDVDDYGFLRRLVVEVIMLLTIGLIFVFALISGLLLDGLWQIVQVVPIHRGFAFQAIEWLVRVLLLFSAFLLTYRYVPRTRPNWRSVVAGAVVATILFLAAQPLFLFYLERFGQYNLIYGSLTIAIILLLWVWIAALITLFGGEIASHTQSILIEGKSERKPGRRRALDHSGATSDTTRSR